MASLFSETFDTGPANGTGLTTSNTGFTSTQTGGTNSGTFDSSAAIFGNFGAKFVQTTGFFDMVAVFGSAQTNAFFSWYAAFGTPSTGAIPFFAIASGASTTRAQVAVTTGGLVELRSPAALVSGAITSSRYDDGLPSRYEWSCVGTVQTLKIYRGANLHGPTASETIGGGAGSITISGFDRFRFGPQSSDTSNTWLMDACQVDGAAMPTVLTEHNNHLLGFS